MNGWTCRLGLLLAALAAWGLACGCEETRVGQDAGDGSILDARIPDARVSDARIPDARVDDASSDTGVIQHDFCNDPFFKLPIDGQTEHTSGIAIDGQHIAWSKQKEHLPSLLGEVYVLHLSTCVEQKLTAGSEAGKLDLHGNTIVWHDLKDGSQNWGAELYSYDLESGLLERLTQTPQVEVEPKTNGRFVAYRRMETFDDPTSLRLMDRQTSDDTELAPAWANIESFDINDRFVVWVAYTQDPQSVGRDVFYYDLQSGETHHLDSTYDRYQYWTFLWSDWITIRGSDVHLTAPKFLTLFNLSTLEERSLLEGDYSVGSGPIDNGLVV